MGITPPHQHPFILARGPSSPSLSLIFREARLQLQSVGVKSAVTALVLTHPQSFALISGVCSALEGIEAAECALSGHFMLLFLARKTYPSFFPPVFPLSKI